MLITDYASAMVDRARQLVSETLQTLPPDMVTQITIEYAQLDACCPNSIPEYSVTLLRCMFGVMFFPDRLQAISALCRLQTSRGLGLYGITLIRQ
jgi:hypothetical protein